MKDPTLTFLKKAYPRWYDYRRLYSWKLTREEIVKFLRKKPL